MATYEFIIAVVDEPEAHRKKEGDILTLRPHGCNWGKNEISRCLVVLINHAGTFEELRFQYQAPLYAGGLVEHVDFSEIYDHHDMGIDPVKYPPDLYRLDLITGKAILKPEIIARNRYKILLSSFGLQPTELAKVQDKAEMFQPFKAASQLVQRFDGIDGRYLIEEKDVDCVTTTIGKEQEVIWPSSLIIDKFISVGP